MFYKNSVLAFLVTVGAALGGISAFAADLKSPDAVKTSLRIMMQVTNDFDRQITRKSYTRLPHENEEFTEGIGALRQAIASEPADFKAKVGPAMEKATAAAQKTADLSTTNDDAKIRAGHADLLKAVNAVFVFFPQELRPDPNVAPGRSGNPPPAAAPK